MNLAPHPSGEECTVLELAQVESDEKCSGHENQREQRGVGLASDRHRHGLGAVAQHECDVFCRGVPSCAVVQGATFQRVLLENLPDDTRGFKIMHSISLQNTHSHK